MTSPKTLLCRLAARASESPAILAATAWTARRLLGPRATDAEALAQCLPVKLLGYPFALLHIPNNLHTVGLIQRIRNRNMPLRPMAKRPPRRDAEVLRIGMVGELTFGGARPVSIIEQFPGPHEFFVFDAAGPARFGPVPQRRDIHFSRHDLGGDYSRTVAKGVKTGIPYLRAIRELAEAINAARLDLLVVANASLEEKNDIATLCDTPCIVGYPMGSEPVYNPKVDFTLYPQHKVWYFLENHRLHSIFTRRPITAEPCYETVPPVYERSPTPPPDVPWEQREPLILFHGRLHQLHSPEYLGLLAGLLEADRDLRFEFLGPGDAQPVLRFFERAGLAGQVAYRGVVDKARYLDGSFHKRINAFITRGRLEPNPWPLGGGLSRIEAYHAGTPTVHLRMTPGRNWASGATWVDLPRIEVPSATADTVDEYRELCRRCLYDRDFAETVRREQRAVAATVEDAGAWWGEVVRLYREWAAGTGWAAGLRTDEVTS